MANALKGEVGVKAGGKDFVFRPTFDTICSAEEKFASPVLPLIDRHDSGQMTIRQQVELLQHFAVGEVTVEALGEALFSEGLNLIRSTVYRVLTVCVAGGKDAAKNTKTPAEPERSTGASSPK